MLKEYWELTKQAFEKDRPSEYTLWIKPVKYMSEKEGEITLSVANDFVKERIEDRYRNILTNLICNISKEKIKLNFILSKKTIDKSDDIRFNIRNEEELAKKVRMKPKPLPFLNPKYTFDRYIIGDNNNLACIAAKKIVESAEAEYNPFFIYGGVGLGKTHLAQAIAHSIHESDVTKKIVYVTSEQFLNDFTSSVAKKNMPQFRLKYRKADILIIDDIQFLENMDSTQQEIFHIYNALKDEGKQMVFTSDRAPYDLQNIIVDRLISRFKSGLVVEIKKPSFEMRKKILKLKLAEYNIQVSENIVNMIAETLTENIRDLESTINRIRFLYCDMGIKNISEGSIQSYLDGIVETGNGITEKEKRISVEQIQKIVAGYYNINYADMKSKKRTHKIAKPRQIAMYLARELTSLSTVEIGNEFGGRNHSTVLFAVDKIRKLLDEGSFHQNEYDNLKKEILN